MFSFSIGNPQTLPRINHCAPVQIVQQQYFFHGNTIAATDTVNRLAGTHRVISTGVGLPRIFYR